MGHLQKAVSQRGLTVVDVGNNREIAYMLHSLKLPYFEPFFDPKALPGDVGAFDYQVAGVFKIPFKRSNCLSKLGVFK